MSESISTNDPIILGIDFGTTNTCVSYYHNDEYKILPNDRGNYTTPSCIYFDKTSSEILYGETALEKHQNPNGTLICNIKRLFGVTWESFKQNSDLQNFFKHLHIEAATNSEYCCIVLQHNNQLHYLQPHNIVQMYLQWLLEFIKKTIEYSNEVVITVPVEFDINQRCLLKEIFCKLNLNVLRIINEPTSATLAYISQNLKDIETECILVVDCGGGTTDFTILETDTNYFEVLQTSGDQFLGGEDLTNNLLNYILSKLDLDKTNISTKLLQKIREICDMCKKELSYKNTSTLFLENIDDKDYKISVSQNIFTNINTIWFEKFKNMVSEICHGLTINQVILVGGTTRIPKIKEIVTSALGNQVYVNNVLNPDHTISIGAAVQGYILKKVIDDKDITFVDTISMSLGIKTVGDIMTPIISKNTIIPCSRTETFSTTDDEPTIDIEVYQGERRFVQDNLKLGTFSIKRSKTEQETVQITFDITSDGILIVTARNVASEKEMSVTFTNYTKTLHSDYIYQDDIEKIQDMERSNLIMAKVELNNTFRLLTSISKTKEFTNIEYDDLILKTSEIINNYTDYTAKYLIEYKQYFETTWNRLHFLQE